MRKNKGFSLMEMLIVVAILAALVAIGYPQFNGAFERNRENADIVFMQSAEALLETAYATGLRIDGVSARKATNEHPLYYDPAGELTWVQPEAYGEGTPKDSGITWSCCDDYHYASAGVDYRTQVVVCYYENADTDHPIMHVHWVVGPGAGSSSKPLPDTPDTPTPKPDPDPDPKPNPDPRPTYISTQRWMHTEDWRAKFWQDIVIGPRTERRYIWQSSTIMSGIRSIWRTSSDLCR